MKPVSFHPEETILTLPGDDSVLPLPVLLVTFSGGVYARVSCWKPTWKDLWRMLCGKPIYLVLHGIAQPPVSLTTEDLGLNGN